jgi:hypothetical protein
MIERLAVDNFGVVMIADCASRLSITMPEQICSTIDELVERGELVGHPLDSAWATPLALQFVTPAGYGMVSLPPEPEPEEI